MFGFFIGRAQRGWGFYRHRPPGPFSDYLGPVLRDGGRVDMPAVRR